MSFLLFRTRFVAARKLIIDVIDCSTIARCVRERIVRALRRGGEPSLGLQLEIQIDCCVIFNQLFRCGQMHFCGIVDVEVATSSERRSVAAAVARDLNFCSTGEQ